uniref:Uncharacterized protein n=1 Tax=Anguilla anguilla TaxID=7936 RepID=A0A0E9VJV1_ANGAN
MTGPCSLVNF